MKRVISNLICPLLAIVLCRRYPAQEVGCSKNEVLKKPNSQKIVSFGVINGSSTCKFLITLFLLKASEFGELFRLAF